MESDLYIALGRHADQFNISAIRLHRWANEIDDAFYALK